MLIYDISMPITKQMPVYKGKEEKRPNITVAADFSTGSVYESILTMNLHTGTHLDRPLHMIPNGSTLETLELSKVITRAKILDLTSVNDKITADDLKHKNIEEGDFVLLKTKNSFEDILENQFIYVDRTGAEYLKEMKICGVGIDSLGIERNQSEHETHIMLLNEDIVILEGLCLSEIEEGDYLLIAAPVKLVGTEASPVRAILLK
jgi:arylformamidase